MVTKISQFQTRDAAINGDPRLDVTQFRTPFRKAIATVTIKVMAYFHNKHCRS
jgi:hypothetical protein